MHIAKPVDPPQLATAGCEAGRSQHGRSVTERLSIATRRYLLGDAVLRVIRLHTGMVLDALEMRDELGRDAIGQIGWNVAEPGPDHVR